MKQENSKLLKILFLVHFFVAVIFGLALTFFVELYASVTGWPYLDPITGRGLAVASLLAWRETKWEQVKIFVQMEITWLGISAVVHIWAIILFPFLIIIWLQTAISIFFFVAFAWFYYDQERAK